MTPDERWQRVKHAVTLILKRPSEDRAAALDEASGGDPSIRREAAELISCHDEMGDFLADPFFGESPEAPPEHDIPAELRQWTRYEVIKRLGSGGMAIVYQARDPRLQRMIAIKVISTGDDLTVRRFLREAEAQARVDHDHVLKIYETGVVGPHHYIAMRYVDGPTLLGVRAETTLDQKVGLMHRVAEGLHAAHSHGLVHRDIKPGNILVERTALSLRPYVLDFGLAVELGAPSLTQTGMVVGTPRYMAPERIHGGMAALDRRSDIYSLGATMYEFISGVAPFAATTGLQVLVDVLQGEITPLRHVQRALPQDLDAIVARCLEREPQHRYPSARALADDLRRYLEGDQVLARPVGLWGRVAKRVRRHPRLAAAFAVMAALTLAIALWGAYGYWSATRQAELARELGQEIRDLEWLLRAAQMSPLHDIQPQKRLVRERMVRLERVIAQAGAAAFGPGQYALGRGFFALGEPPRALDHLTRAWNSGYQTADSATALGLAHAEVFRIEIGKAQRIAVDPERHARIHALEQAHRDPALQHLEWGQSNASVPDAYVAAVLASHRGDFTGAIAHARQAAADLPWLFEAHLLPGHFEFKEAVRLYLRGSVIDCLLYTSPSPRD